MFVVVVEPDIPTGMRVLLRQRYHQDGIRQKNDIEGVPKHHHFLFHHHGHHIAMLPHFTDQFVENVWQR